MRTAMQLHAWLSGASRAPAGELQHHLHPRKDARARVHTHTHATPALFAPRHRDDIFFSCFLSIFLCSGEATGSNAPTNPTSSLLLLSGSLDGRMRLWDADGSWASAGDLEIGEDESQRSRHLLEEGCVPKCKGGCLNLRVCA